MIRLIGGAVVAASLGAAGVALAAEPIEVTISVKDHKFDPSEIQAPPDTPVKVTVKNLDAKPMEFESSTLRFEKMVTGNGQVTLTIRGQKPGTYEFYDDFHDETRGTLVVK